MNNANTQDGRRVPTRQQRLAGFNRMIKDGALDLALRSLDEWLKTSPADADIWALKSAAFEQGGKLDDAHQAIARAAELNPTSLPLRLAQARLANLRRNETDEVRALAVAVTLGPIPERLLNRLITLQMKRQEFREALASADRLVQLNPDHEPHLLKRIDVLIAAGQLQEAKAALERMLSVEEPSDNVTINWAALVAERMGDMDAVVARLQALSQGPKPPWSVFACLGRALAKIGRTDSAIAALLRSTELAPDHAGNWYDLGVLQRQVGQVEASQASMTRSLELDSTSPGALRIAGYEHKYSYGDDAFCRVNLALSKLHELPPKSQVEIHYAAAKALEDVGETKAAFTHYARAGQLQKELCPWSDTRMRGVLALMRNYLKPEDYRQIKKQCDHTDKPVFVFGMPRSGTTLLEQVIASHPQAYGAGELKLAAGVLNGIKIGRARLETMYDGTSGSLADGEHLKIPERGRKYLEVVESLAGQEPLRIVDKMPGNYNWVGLLDAVLPGAHFIHSRRHPVDTCLSQYRIFFPDGINFSYDLRDLGKAYRLYHNYMEYWSSLIGDRILHVRYEDIVADLETQARRIIAYIGLPWDDACLRFYETERKVLTASVTQVRRPIYTSSVNRWRKYETYLKPLLDELGPLVQQYEDELAASASK